MCYYNKICRKNFLPFFLEQIIFFFFGGGSGVFFRPNNPEILRICSSDAALVLCVQAQKWKKNAFSVTDYLLFKFIFIYCY